MTVDFLLDHDVILKMILHKAGDLSYKPQRIISLVPSITELLYSLSLEEETIAITKFCIHPSEWFRNKVRIGGTKNLDITKILSLKPDLIIANKEENVKDQVETLAENCAIWLTDINNIDDAYEMILSIGTLTHKKSKSILLLNNIIKEFDKIKEVISVSNCISVAYLIWQEPLMTIGHDTFINSVLEAGQFKNVFDSLPRYPQITMDEIRSSGCEAILLSSEPFPFNDDHVKYFEDLFPGIKIILVDGEMFSWYGNRLLKTPDYIKTLHEQLKN